jgi:phosphoglycerate dehydrogenase-like enzyme
MEKRRIWIRVPIPAEDMQILRREFPHVHFIMDDGEMRNVEDIDGVFTDDPVPENLLAHMQNLRWIHVTRGGANAYLTPEVKRRPIQVTGSKGIHGRSFSEFALACIFALAKKLPESWENQKEKKWRRVEPEEVAGKTLGIVGLGTVGSELAQKAKALGMRVVATKRAISEKPGFVDELGGPEFLPRLLEQSDFVVLSLASIPSTEKMIGEKELRVMKASAYFINLTGGKAVEEKALIRALKDNRIAGAALDAFAKQPLPPDSELWTLPNVIISARAAGATAQKWELMLPIFADNLRRFTSGEPLRNVVDKELGY